MDFDRIVEQVLKGLGKVKLASVMAPHAEECDSGITDPVLVGKIDKSCLVRVCRAHGGNDRPQGTFAFDRSRVL